MAIDIITAIKAINPNAKVSVSDESFEQITWHNGTTVISQADIEAKQAELQTAYNALNYARTRAASYSEVKEQLDLLYHDMAADKGDKTGEWFKAVKKVKDDNPKG